MNQKNKKPDPCGCFGDCGLPCKYADWHKSQGNYNPNGNKLGDVVYFLANNKLREGKIIYDYFTQWHIEVKIRCDGEILIHPHYVDKYQCFSTIDKLFKYLKSTKRMLLNE